MAGQLLSISRLSRPSVRFLFSLFLFQLRFCLFFLSFFLTGVAFLVVFSSSPEPMDMDGGFNVHGTTVPILGPATVLKIHLFRNLRIPSPSTTFGLSQVPLLPPLRPSSPADLSDTAKMVPPAFRAAKPHAARMAP